MKYVTAALSRRFDHPLLASMFILAGVFVVLGGVVDLLGTNPIAAGFFGVYAITSAVLGGLGYALTYAVQRVSRLRDEADPQVGDTGN